MVEAVGDTGEEGGVAQDLVGVRNRCGKSIRLGKEGRDGAGTGTGAYIYACGGHCGGKW